MQLLHANCAPTVRSTDALVAASCSSHEVALQHDETEYPSRMESPIELARDGRMPVARMLFAALLLGGAIVWAYAPILDNGFVWDDGANLGAARVHWDRGLDGLIWAFREPFFGHYQPLTWVSYQIDSLLSGATPRGVHATQLVLHLANTVLVGWLAWILATCRALGAVRPLAQPRYRAAWALVAAALFALHPMQVESVAWATERRDLLSTFFVLAALALHLRSAPTDASPSPVRGRVALLHALAALSRAQMSLPFVLMLADIWPLRRLEATADRWKNLLQLVREKALSFAIAAASAAAALWAQASQGALTSVAEHGLLGRLVQAGYGFAFYPTSWLFGRVWLPLYERPYPFDPSLPHLFLPALAAAAALAGLWFVRRRVPAVAVAFVAYLLLVLPVLGIAQSGVQLVADRYAYLSTVPLVLLATGAGVVAWGRMRAATARAAIALGFVAFVSANTLATRQQTRVWQDDETLWRHVLNHSDSALADNNLGYLLLNRGEHGPALFHLVRSLEHVPSYGRPWRGIVALLEAPRPADAPNADWVAVTLERAARTQPGSALASRGVEQARSVAARAP